MATLKQATKFLESIIDLRIRDPQEFLDQVLPGLEKLVKRTHKIEANWETEGLGRDFFGESNFLTLKMTALKKTKTTIIGKGMLYDSGGYNIKTSQDGTMFFDRNGAFLTLASAAAIGVNAHVFITNNLVDSFATLPGEILTEPRTGKRIYISNTDAEGRIGLADLLARHGANEKLITIATLTGAAVQVTGDRTFALVHAKNPGKYYKDLLNSTLHGYEFFPAPFHKKYDESVKSKINNADIEQCPSFRAAGSSTAFSFLKEFAATDNYLHLDIAAMMCDADKNGLVWGIKEVEELVRILK